MRTDPWSLVFLAGFIAYASIRGIYNHRQRTEGKEAVARRVDAMEVALLWLVLPGALLLPLVYLFSGWLAFADYRLPAFAPWCGLVAMGASLWLFRRSHADLGLNFSQLLEVRREHELVTRGVYRAIRHPMYASIWLWNVGQGLMLENWLAGWYAFVAFAALYFIRVPREEALMRETFGPQYAAYMQRTGRLFPRWPAKNGS